MKIKHFWGKDEPYERLFHRHLICKSLEDRITYAILNDKRVLNLSRLGLSEVPIKEIQEIKDLEILILSSNQITRLSPGIFKQLVSLKRLYLNNNKLTVIDADTFSGLVNLTELSLGRNKVVSVDRTAFAGLPSLERLILSYNHLVNASFSLRTLAPRVVNLQHNSGFIDRPRLWRMWVLIGGMH